MPYKKRNHRIKQHGGTIIKVIKDGKETVLETPFSDSKILLENLHSIRCISTTSFGSYVFVGRLKETPSVLLEREPQTSPPSYVTDVCFKVMFVGPGENVIFGESKEVVTEIMADAEVKTQHEMYKKLLRNRNEGQLEVVIPDAFGSCILTPDEFNKLLEPTTVISVIFNIAVKHNLNLYVAFIDYLDGFVTFNDAPESMKVLTIIGASILELFMKTGCFSLDMHRKNIMIAQNKVKIIDFGKVVCLDRDTAYVTQMFKTYLSYNFVSSNENTLKSLDAASFKSTEHFKGIERKKNTHGNKELLKAEIIENFVTYCSELPGRLKDWSKNPPHDKAIFVFDLLTFIGFVDCLKWRLRAVMKFGWLLNLLLQTGMGERFTINDVISIRGDVFGNPDSIKTYPIIAEIVNLLDEIFTSKKSKDGGNKRTVTKNRRRISRRKPRMSRRKH
jgi:hypothetical protein